MRETGSELKQCPFCNGITGSGMTKEKAEKYAHQLGVITKEITGNDNWITSLVIAKIFGIIDTDKWGEITQIKEPKKVYDEFLKKGGWGNG